MTTNDAGLIVRLVKKIDKLELEASVLKKAMEQKRFRINDLEQFERMVFKALKRKHGSTHPMNLQATIEHLMKLKQTP